MSKILAAEGGSNPTARLVLGPSPGGPGNGLSERVAVLWVSAETMFALKLAPGCCALVSIADKSGQNPRKIINQYIENYGIQNPLVTAEEATGDYAVTAEIWPDPRLQPKTSVASSTLHESLGKPDAGSTVLLFKDDVEDSKTSSAHWDSIVLQLCLHQASSSSTEGNLIPMLQSQLNNKGANALAQTGVNDTASPAATPPARPARQSGRPPPRVMSPGMKAGGSLTPGSAAKSSTPKPKPVQSQPSSINLTQASAVLKALQESGDQSKLKEVIALLVKNQIGGQRVLVGNLLMVPILGMSALFRICEASRNDETTHALGKSVGLTTIISFSPTGQDSLPGNTSGYSLAASKAAATELGGSTDGAPAMAALHAAQLGEASVGTTFGDLGGSKSQISSLHELVRVPLQAHSVFSSYRIAPPKGVLLYGPPGTGKTALARAAATESGAKLFVINGPDVVSEYFGESESGIKGVFAAARALAPSVIFIDEVDAIAPSRDGRSGSSGGNNVSSRLVTTLLTEMDHLQGHAVVVLAATNRVEAVDSALRRPGRFDREIEVDVPSPAGRRDILRILVDKMNTSLSPNEVDQLANSAHGFVGADLAALCSEAAMFCLRRLAYGTPGKDDVKITLQDFLQAETRIRPSGLREVTLEVPKVSWDDIGGQKDIKQQLSEAVELPFKSPELLRKLGAKPPRGILLFGPPGCSKTLIARAVAGESGLNFFSVKGPELYSKYVGESEKALATLFKKARSSSPAVVFFDEIDGLVTSRAEEGSGSVDVSDRVLSQLLQEMDGLQGHEERAVVVIAATNRPDSIDPALLRPGRFDRLLYVPPPDIVTREAIFAVHTRKMPLARDVDLASLAAVTEGYTGADVAAICQHAGYLALEDSFDASEVKMEHFLCAVGFTPPSATIVDKLTQDSYTRFLRQCS